MFRLRPSEEELLDWLMSRSLPCLFEERLSNYCIQMANMGFGLSKEDIMHSAFLLAEKSGLKHPFKNGKTGIELGLRRNPHLSIRQPQSLSVATATSFFIFYKC